MKNTELITYMLDDIRKVTLKGVSGLTKEQLFAEPVPGEFPIGAYLMHLAEVDLGWLKVMDGNESDPELAKRSYDCKWFDAGKDYDPPKGIIEIEEYLHVMEKCRAKVIDYIKNLDDSILEEKYTVVRKFDGKEFTREYTRKWIIYHLIEHEAHTRGQMFMLLRMAGFKKKGDNN
ncbi:MAG: DinB family protein [Ignavibacteria bacterium]